MKFTVALIISLIPTLFGSDVQNRDIPVLGEYAQLYTLCVDGGDASYVGVRYSNSDETRVTDMTYNYDERYPYTLDNGDLAQVAVFCKNVVCYSYPNLDCTGPVTLAAPLVDGLVLINAADIVQEIGECAKCQKFLL